MLTFTSSGLALAVRSDLPAIPLRSIAPPGHPMAGISPSFETDHRKNALITSFRPWVEPNEKSERRMAKTTRLGGASTGRSTVST